MSHDTRAVLPGVIASFACLALLAACSVGEHESPGHAFHQADSRVLLGMSVKPGQTAIFRAFELPAQESSTDLVLNHVGVSGSASSATHAQVQSVALYALDENEAPVGGTLPSVDQLSRFRARKLDLPKRLDPEVRYGLAVVLAGVTPGQWRTDYVDLKYAVNGGQKKHERIRVALGLCVDDKAPVLDCDFGDPSWRER